MNTFLSFLKKETNLTHTENGAIALKSTNSSLLDLFGMIGSLRTRTAHEIETLFIKAFHEDALFATKMLFYARNIRGGLGERRTFRILLSYLAKTHPEVVLKNLDAIALFGRYDDFYTLIDTPTEEAMWAYLKAQLIKDLSHAQQHEPISLLSKWLKSVNASSPETKRLGKLTAKKLGYSEQAYRKILATLRHYLDVTEVHMAANEWTSIPYSKVPSRAMMIYRNAFKAHDVAGFNAYLEALTNGTATIHAATLYPYDIIERLGLSYNYGTSGSHYGSFFATNSDPILEAQWNSLPNYVEGEQNILVMADTSGSMLGRPLATSLGLAIYFAERNQGAFHNTFMTFSSQPSLVTLKGRTLAEKIRSIPSIVENTDLEAAFTLILNVALKNHLLPKDLPQAVVVITDMAFDTATTSRGNWTFYESLRQTYARYGYTLPNIIFWNVNARHDCFQTTSDYKGVQLASGQSPSTFKSVLANIGLTPYDAMVNTLNDPIYACIKL